MAVVEKNEDLIAFARINEDLCALFTSIESYSEALATKKDKIFCSAQNYINSADK